MGNAQFSLFCFVFSADYLMSLDCFSHIYQGFVCFHALTVIIIEFFNLNHQCQTHQHAFCSVYITLLTLRTAIVQTISIKAHWILNPRISFVDGCNQDRNYRTCSQSTSFFFFLPHQPHSWTQLKLVLLQSFSQGPGDDGILSSGTQSEGRWGVVFAQPVFTVGLQLSGHRHRQMRHNSWA